MRVSETVGLTWTDVLPRDDRVQLSIQGKGGKARQVLLPDMRGDADANDPVFASRKGGHLTERAVRRGWIAAGHGGPRCQPAVDAGANDPVFASRKGGP